MHAATYVYFARYSFGVEKVKCPLYLLVARLVINEQPWCPCLPKCFLLYDQLRYVWTIKVLGGRGENQDLPRGPIMTARILPPRSWRWQKLSFVCVCKEQVSCLRGHCSFADHGGIELCPTVHYWLQQGGTTMHLLFIQLCLLLWHHYILSMWYCNWLDNGLFVWSCAYHKTVSNAAHRNDKLFGRHSFPQHNQLLKRNSCEIQLLLNGKQCVLCILMILKKLFFLVLGYKVIQAVGVSKEDGVNANCTSSNWFKQTHILDHQANRIRYSLLPTLKTAFIVGCIGFHLI